MLTDFPQIYGTPLREAWESMPGVDFYAHVRRLPSVRGSALRRLLLGDEAEWGPDEENRARLLEVQAYVLELDWIRHTTDPDDPEVRRDRLEAKRRGEKPPPRPIVPPAALRPTQLAEQRFQEWIDQLAATVPKPAKERVSLAEFDQLISRM